MNIQVHVAFKGTVSVSVSDGINSGSAKMLAEKFAVAQILATTNNPDCSECLSAACEEFVESGGKESDFDATEIVSVSGTWQAVE